MAKFTLFSTIKSFFQKKKSRETSVKENTTEIAPPTEIIPVPEAVKTPKPKSPSIQNKEKQSEIPQSLVRSELNLEKNSVFTVSTYKGKSREIVHRETKPTGEILERKIEIGRTPAGDEIGVLTTSHFKVYLYLIELWEQEGKPINKSIHFTSYKIIQRLGMDDNGRSYERVRRWLGELRIIPITFSQSFYNPKNGHYNDLAYTTILNHLRVHERKKIGKAEKTRGYGEFRFDEYILQNLLDNYVHPLRLDIVLSFKQKEIAILLYTFIDRNLAFKNTFEINLPNLFEALDLNQQYIRYPADRKVAIEGAVEELKNKSLSTGILTHCAVEKTKDDKDYKLVCRKKQSQTALNARTTILTQELPKEGRKSQPEADEALINQIRAHKADLTNEQRAELRQRALDKIRSNKNIKEDFITKPLIESFENELIKDEIL